MRHVIVGDVHLTRDGSSPVSRDLAGLIRRHRGDTLVFAGDLLDLAAESSRESPVDAVRVVLGAHEALRVALADHAAHGGDLLVLAGNHDAEIATPFGIAAFADVLRLDDTDRARLRSSPWFARLGPEGALHVEHGHHYDPDNALPHPLSPPDPAWWSLGIGLMHRFVSPMGAGALVHDNDATPLHVLTRAIKLFGPRAPAVISRYLLAAAMQVAHAGPRYPREAARQLGHDALEAFAEGWGLSAEATRALADEGARPTMESMRDTFLRLYWDRALATGIAAAAGTSVLLGGPGRNVAKVAGAVLLASIVLGHNRYRGRVPKTMVAQSARIAETTGARAVVFGHIHVPASDGVYKNTGSFGFPGQAPGRPYVAVDDDGSTRHEFLPRRAA